MSESRALISEKDARLLNRIMLDIAKEVRIDRRFNGRINNLHLLGDFHRPDETVAKMSIPEWKDHPQIQILLERRDRYLQTRANLEIARTALADYSNQIDPEEFPKALMALAKLEGQCADHLKALESCFVAIRHEGMTRTKLLTSMVTDAAQMAESSRMHTERMAVERQKLESQDMNDMLAEVVKDDAS